MKTSVTAAIVLAIAATQAQAQAVAPTAVERELAIRAEIAGIEADFAAHEKSLTRWYVGWTAFYCVSWAAEGAVAVFAKDPGLRADASIGFGATTIGCGLTFAMEPPALTARAKIARVSDPRARLQLARELVAASEADDRLARSPLAHVGVAAVNIGAGMASWLGYSRPVQGIVGGAVGIVIGEVQIFTRPSSVGAIGAAPAVTWRVAPTIGGAMVLGSF